MNHCPDCNKDTDESVCPDCGTELSEPTSKVNDDDAEFDRIIAAASQPSLSTLFERGKKKGLLKPITQGSGGA